MSRAALALTLSLALAGCASSSPAPVDAGRPLAEWWVDPAPAEVSAFQARFDALAAAPACQAELVRRLPEVAHALFVAPSSVGPASRDGVARAALAAALDAAASAGPPGAYAASERARAAHPDEHQRARRSLVQALASRRVEPAQAAELALEAEALFLSIDDALLASQARALACATRGADLELVDHGAPSRALVTRWRLVRLGHASADEGDPSAALRDLVRDAIAFDDATTLEHVEALLVVGALPRDPSWELDWLRALASAALRRGHPLPALRHALALSTAWTRDPRGPTSLEAQRDRLLIGRAHLAAGEHEPALEEGLAVISATEALGVAAASVEGAARALVGDVLLAMDRTDGALEAYARAEDRFLQVGDQPAMWRQALNRAAASLRLGRAAEAQVTLRRVAGPAPASGADATDLEVRRDVLVALASVLAGEATGEAAAVKIDEALATARAAGALDVVERHSGLPALLRAGPRGRSGPG